MKLKTLLRPLLIICACLSFAAAGLRAADDVTASAPKTALPRLIDLGADKCIPCKMMAPILVELRKEYADQLEVVFIDVWKNRDEGERFGISIIPTQIFFDATGKERFRHEGFMAKKDILAKWQEIGVALKEPAGAKEN